MRSYTIEIFVNSLSRIPVVRRYRSFGSREKISGCCFRFARTLRCSRCLFVWIEFLPARERVWVGGRAIIGLKNRRSAIKRVSFCFEADFWFRGKSQRYDIPGVTSRRRTTTGEIQDFLEDDEQTRGTYHLSWPVSPLIHFAFAWRRFYSTNLLPQLLLFIFAVLRWKEHFLVALWRSLWIYWRHVPQKYLFSGSSENILALFRNNFADSVSLCHSSLPLISGN